MVEECQLLSWVMLWQKTSCYIKSLSHFLWNTWLWLIHLAWLLDSNTEMALTFFLIERKLWPEPVSADGATWVYIPSENPASLFLMATPFLIKDLQIIPWDCVFVAALLPLQLGFLANCLFSSDFFQVQVLFLAFSSCPISCLFLATVWVGKHTRKSDNESKIIIFKTSVPLHCDVTWCRGVGSLVFHQLSWLWISLPLRRVLCVLPPLLR